jgi:glycosyltransferase involved in cell wall biosynthesis
MGAITEITFEVGSYNRKRLLKMTIDCIRKEMEEFALGYEIIVVDGGSTDGTIKWLCMQKDIITIVQHNRGKWKGKDVVQHSAGYFHNLAFKIAKGKYICPLSDDCLITPGSIINAYNLFENKRKNGERVAQLSFYTRLWPIGKKYHVRLAFENKMYAGFGMYLNKAIRSVNYFDEETFHFYYIETDLSLKLWQNGWIVIESPDSYVEHYHYANPKIRRENKKKYIEDYTNLLAKWEGIFYDSNKKEMRKDKVIEKYYRDKNQTVKRFGYRCYLYAILKTKIYDFFSKYVVTRKIHNLLKVGRNSL